MCITCQIVELSNSEHSQLSLLDMSPFREFLLALMDFIAHWHMLCSASRFKALFDLLVRDVEEVVKQEEVPESEEPDTF